MDSASVIQIQKALFSQGYDPGEIDGVWGRRTIAAVRAFQKNFGLTVDGVVGPATQKKLFRASDGTYNISPVLPWFEEARRLSGTKEILGPRNNPEILDWASDLDIYYPGDDVPWCGLFTAHCIGATLPDEVLPKDPLTARAWERFGDPTEPRFGAIMVFWRGSITSGKGHVGFYAGEDTKAFRILGGNQSDRVSVAWISRERFIRARWPRSAVNLVGGITTVHVERREDLSHNEA
ncbi:TIGR02594 family protein [Massilia suwonensis]|uniref:TIGR02594 family protein n=2 Tax=Massilia suwonensis TaxID=648895 RepID=A0ABW0MLM4_9BURK